ncbi:MAG: winged helix-turn-helix domain-containing protein [Pseudobdellovibrionaceae bacterium]
MISISQKEARSLIISTQGYMAPAGSKSLPEWVKHLGYVQLDAINRVERAHHHILWSRDHSYRSPNLNQAMSLPSPRIFEYWAHAAAYLPIDDFRFSLLRKKRLREQGHGWHKNVDKKIGQEVLKRIEAEGPLANSHFSDLGEKAKRKGPWFDWSPVKIVIEQLFSQGDLMVVRREKFQKVYDLTSRVLPSSISTDEPSIREYIYYLIDQASRSHGLFRLSEVTHLKKADFKQKTHQVFNELIEDNKFVNVRVKGLECSDIYASPKLLEGSCEVAIKVRILSPFDNLVIHRKWLQDIFQFPYRLECYVPENKRTWGYFALPVLWGHQFVGWLDCKANRKTKTLEIERWGLVEKVSKNSSFKKAFETELEQYAAFNGCESWVFLSKRPKLF